MPIERLLDLTPDPPEPAALYERLALPPPPDSRPYLYANMVATVDGKIVVGPVGGPAKGVGGPTDQVLFRRLQRTCDAVLLGAATIRAGAVIYPPELPRFTVTESGDLPESNRFFTDAPDRAYVLAPESLDREIAERLSRAATVLRFGRDRVDLAQALAHIRTVCGIHTMLCEGGPTLLDALLRASLMDELFLTIAPSLKGGANVPTVVTGAGFPPGRFARVELRSLYRDGDELYLRYRIVHS